MVVRPEEKREKKKRKRLADPSRQNYSSILDKTNASGSGAFERLAQQSGGEASEIEAAAVARAIGLNQGFGSWKGFKKEGDDGSPLARTASGRSDTISETESPSPTSPLIMDSAMEDVPEMDDLEGSALSDSVQEWEEPEGEEGAESKTSEELSPINDLTVRDPEEAEVSRGRETEV